MCPQTGAATSQVFEFALHFATNSTAPAEDSVFETTYTKAAIPYTEVKATLPVFISGTPPTLPVQQANYTL